MNKGDIVITGLEAKARVLTNEMREYGVDNHPELPIIQVANALYADWAAARPRVRWVILVNALAGYQVLQEDSATARRTFALLVRKGWLRSYMSYGRRLYELAL